MCGCRRKRPRNSIGFIVALSGLVLGFGGCGSSTDVVPLTNAEKALTNLALGYMDAHAQLNRGPKNVDELKGPLKTFGNPDQLLVSPNDGEPFVIIWGADMNRGGPTAYEGMFQILAYERKGKGGRRAIVDVRGRPMTIPDEDFSKLTFARGQKSAD